MNDASPITDAELAQAARAEPVAERTADQVERAAQLFASSTHERAIKRQARAKRSRAVIIIIAVALPVVVGLCAVTFVVGRMTADAPPPHVVVDLVELKPAPGAVFDRIERGPVHAARIYEGALLVAGATLPPGERLIVLTGDAEIEGAAAVFEVTAERDRLRRVRVIEGTAQLRPIGGAPRELAAGDVVDVPVAAALPSSDGQRERMNAGLAKLAANDLLGAASLFGAEARLAGSPFLEDATFWEAIALSRAKRPEATAKIQSFLARFPSSTHRAETVAVLGWQLVDAGEGAAARAAFDDAMKNGDERVRASAAAGLTKLGPAPRP